ncbi:MAG: cyclic nucleotide-binding domain-containing protein [Dokdonella sp.]
MSVQWMSKPDAYLDVAAGEAVFREGEVGQTMFVIESGMVEIHLAARGREAVATLGPGDFFGEMAMLEDQPRFASAIAREPARLLRVERAGFADLLRQNVEIAVRIMRKLSARHRRSEARLADALAEIDGLRRKSESAPAVPAKSARPHDSMPAGSAPPPAARSREAARGGAIASPASIAAPPTAPASVLHAQPSCMLRHAGGDVFPLDPTISQFLVGRPDPVAGIDPEINLSAVDATRSLSRRHAKLVREGSLYCVREEVGTVNGTFVNGVRVKTGVDVAITPGDLLRFGAVEVEFVAV